MNDTILGNSEHAQKALLSDKPVEKEKAEEKVEEKPEAAPEKPVEEKPTPLEEAKTEA